MNAERCNYFTTACLARLLNKMAEDIFKEVGLAPTYAYIMTAIYFRPGIDCKSLCEEMFLTPSTLTRMADKLEKLGYIAKEQSGRCALHKLTPIGDALMQPIQAAFAQLGCEQERILGQDLSKRLAKVAVEAIEAFNNKNKPN